jgi:hypothetical protein
MNSTPSPHRSRTPAEQSGPDRSPPWPRAREQTSPSAPKDCVSAAGEAVSGVLESGVRTAYAVIDEYLRRGQDTARGIFNDLNMRGSMNNNRQNCSGGPGYGYTPWNPMAMVAEQMISAMCAWSQAWCSTVPGFRQPPMNPCSSTEVRAETIRLKVTSSQAVECSGSLCQGQDLHCVESEPLRPQGIQAGDIPAAKLYMDEGKVVIEVNVPPKQLKGTYRGLIRKKTDRTIVGEATVEVK